MPIVELRQYTLQPGQRDKLIDLFERALLEPQEEAGMYVLGQFVDLDRADRFVWLRGFADMERRRSALEAFYTGPAWCEHRETANATMVDSDDVLLLRPAVSGALLALPPRPPATLTGRPGVHVVTICSLQDAATGVVLERHVMPALRATSAPPLAILVEEPSDNTFPALPVREGEHVVVWIQRANERNEREVRSTSRAIAESVLPSLLDTPLQLRLEPTPRSRLR